MLDHDHPCRAMPYLTLPWLSELLLETIQPRRGCLLHLRPAQPCLGPPPLFRYTTLRYYALLCFTLLPIALLYFTLPYFAFCLPRLILFSSIVRRAFYQSVLFAESPRDVSHT
jgi:hypothetical protein